MGETTQASERVWVHGTWGLTQELKVEQKSKLHGHIGEKVVVEYHNAEIGELADGGGQTPQIIVTRVQIDQIHQIPQFRWEAF